jgi:hypothetical protein
MCGVYRVLTDLGSFLGGILALIAAGFAVFFAYRIGQRQALATKEASDAQLAAVAAKERRQAKGIAVGVYPELLEIGVLHERATNMIKKEWSKDWSGRTYPDVAAYVRDTHIRLPPILDRSFDYLYLLGDAAHSLQQLVSVILQYNGMLDALARHIEHGVASANLASHAQDFLGELEAVRRNVEAARRDLQPFHDEAVPPRTV